MKFSTILFFIFLTTAQETQALVCPNPESAPACPTNGSLLLDDTYPTQSFLISNMPYVETKEAKGMTQSFVKKIIENYDYENVPQIMLSLENPEEYAAIKANVKSTLTEKKVAPDKIEKILAQITHVQTIRNLNWQQDWFESFINPKTGSPVIRQIESYTRAPGNNSALLEKAGAQCGVADGDFIKSDMISMGDDARTTKKSFGSGEMGGNIEGAPGGICMVGDNQGKDFSTQFCNKENIIQLQTSWLNVGHVDELFKITPTQFLDGRPHECEFSVMSASPKKALELMKNPEMGKTPFVEFNPEADPVEERTVRSHSSFAGNLYICDYVKNIIKNKPASQEIKPAVKSVLLKLLFGSDVQASFDFNTILSPEVTDNPTVAASNAECAKNIDKVSNFEIQEMMTGDPKFMALNTAIDESIAKDRELLKNKILSRLPQCKTYYNEIEAPSLFYGAAPVKNKDGNWELPRPGTANSFLPNPTNSVVMNKTLTLSNTGNGLFNRYLTDELAKKKMKTDFVSTWDYAHLAQGNIHCASHSIPYCRPNTKGSK